jgi:hypothetical protein
MNKLGLPYANTPITKFLPNTIEALSGVILPELTHEWRKPFVY